MRIKYCLFLIFFFPIFAIWAQENPMFTLSPWTQPFYNPGAMGENERQFNLSAVFRQCDLGSRGDTLQPTTSSNPTGSNNDKVKYEKQDGQQILIYVDSYLKKIKGAVSVMFLQDKISSNDNIEVRLGYAQRFRVRGGKLGVGLHLGFYNQKYNKDKMTLNPTQQGDPTIIGIQQNPSFMDFDLNFGLHYKAPTWYAGVSASQLIGGVRISGENGYKSIPRQLYFTGGYIWNLKTAVPWSIEPHLLFRTNLATWTFNAIAVARYNGILWFGLAYQYNYAISVHLGAVPFYNNANEYLKALEIGLAYSFITAKYGMRTGGSWGDFEILVRYGFNFYKEKSFTGYGSSRHLYKNQY